MAWNRVASRMGVVAVTFAGLANAPAALAGVVEMDWVTVGDVGNVDDVTFSGSAGAVDYAYRIGTYEVTNAQYATFLNAAARSDPTGLYSIGMGFDARGGIIRSGSEGSFTYSVKPNMGNKPVNFVSWFDAARMANWMTNGQPTDGSGTESGVYTLDGPTSVSAITRDLNDTSQVFLPTEDEWYKAAYYQPASRGGDDDGYWLFATQSNETPTVATATSTGDVANPGPDTVNYNNSVVWGGNVNVTSVGSANNTSFYGAYDMAGNVSEWNETIDPGGLHVFSGGSYLDASMFLEASTRGAAQPTLDFSNARGFRFASPVPGPGTLALTIVTAPLVSRRRRG